MLGHALLSHADVLVAHPRWRRASLVRGAVALAKA